jgi:hypothetical protein
MLLNVGLIGVVGRQHPTEIMDYKGYIKCMETFVGCCVLATHKHLIVIKYEMFLNVGLIGVVRRQHPTGNNIIGKGKDNEK